MALIISDQIRDKIFIKHRVSEREIKQCFRYRLGDNLIDNREEHRTDPPTEWFLGKTSAGQVLVIFFINKDGDLHIKTAFSPTEERIEVYRRVLGLSIDFLSESDE